MMEAVVSANGTIVCEDGLRRPVWAASDPLRRHYYDTEWGMPVTDERGMYERVMLEGFQAGLSWDTILRKRPTFRIAFKDFNPDVVAEFTDADRERLMADPGIIRNRAKINAAITNARATIHMREEGGLADFIWSFRPASTPSPRTIDEIPTQSADSIALSKALKTKGFTFVGPTTMFAMMESIGMIDTHLIDSHRRGTSGLWAN
ncbi:MAG: DNA-3-methyladenine glycosylase I [Actinomycetota bacterium]|nr:DNA-3-methyladenine glycosylase I [Actinomycetota bacterium]